VAREEPIVTKSRTERENKFMGEKNMSMGAKNTVFMGEKKWRGERGRRRSWKKGERRRRERRDLEGSLTRRRGR